jgi:uncharacterized membrane protein YhaH (DUF805 family)
MNRKNYIITVLGGFIFANLVLLLNAFISQTTGPDSIITKAMGVAIILIAIYIAITWVRAAIMRSRDFNLVGWVGALIFIFVTPSVFVFAFIPGTNGNNDYGPKPSKRFYLKTSMFWFN